jgi:hypothetical protein
MIHTSLVTFAAGCNGNFLLPTWHKYLPHADGCKIDLDNFMFPNDIAPIALAVVEILLRVGVLAAVGFVIYGGFLFMTSQGEPDKAANARRTIINAVVGLVIGLLATGLVNFIGRQLL